MRLAKTTQVQETLQREKLFRILGVGFGIAVIIGGTIGAGILRMPGVVASQLKNPWLILLIWTLAGAYSLLGALSLTELGTMLPQAGGFYVYARRAFGEAIGFTVGCADWFNNCAAPAYVSITFGEYLIKLVPGFTGHVNALAILMLLGFAVLQWMGIRLSSRTQELTSLIKALSFLVLVIACFIFGAQDDAFQPDSGSLPFSSTPTALFLAVMIALQAVIVTYDGYHSAIYFTEEDRDPGHNLPRAMIGGVLSVIAIYLLVNLALLCALPLPQLAASKLAAADAAQRIFGAQGGRWITMLALVTLLPLMNALLLIASRIPFAMGRDHLFSSKAALVNVGGTPGVALTVSVLLAMALVASGTFEKLVALSAFLVAAINCVCFAALFVLRKREPGLARPFKVWGYPLTPLVVLAGSSAFLVGALCVDTKNSLYALCLLLVSYPAYRLFMKFVSPSSP
jgi:APA family basic amino acid/polyamine antiporter